MFTRWHKMYQDVNRVLKGCHVCNLNDYKNRNITLPLKIHDKDPNVMTHLTIDFQTDVPKNHKKIVALLTVIDEVSSIIKIIPVKDKKAST
eukprot:Nk52_evm1s1699 gene=Nk52_evmTU1s1699